MLDPGDSSDPPAAPPAQNGTSSPPVQSSVPSYALEDSISPQDTSPSSSNLSSENSENSTPNPDLSTKKTYLSLLPPEQIIEICLLFETHVPLQVKTTIWPADLEATILELQKKASSSPSSQSQPQREAAIAPPPIANGTLQASYAGAPSHQVHPPGHGQYTPPLVPPQDVDPPMGSLRDPAEEAKEKANALDTVATASAMVPPATQTNGGGSSSENQHAPHTAHSQPPSAHSSHTATPQPQGQPQHATLHPPAPYPYAHYGYAMPQPQGQQPAYPHAPYYPPPPAYPSHYPYPYPPHPGYPVPPHGHSPPPPHAHGSQLLFNSNPLVRPPLHPSVPTPQPPPPPSGEDLPSYEEMIVEALLDCEESEGAAPKDLFTWMASRYPLQTNFRPSASQALQKAYKRGRLEKRAGGKYRLNSAWEGGTTSRRTTRRPQTLAQTTYAMLHPPTQPTSLFTHAPLQQQPPATAQQAQYNGYYQYPYGHYPGYPNPHYAQGLQPSQEKAAAQPPPPAAQSDKNVTIKTSEEKDEGDSGDAWEAAQHILQAINFGSLANVDASTADTSARPSASSGDVSMPLPISAADGDGLTAVLTALANAAAASAQAEASRTTLTDDERASLQAQLALLAAQLTEVADDDDDEEEGEGEEEDEEEDVPMQDLVSQPVQSQYSQPSRPVPQSALPPQPIVSASTAHAHIQVPASVQHKAVELAPPPIAAYAGTHLVLDVNAFPEVFPPNEISAGGFANTSAAQTEAEIDELGEDDSDDDDDMEDVVVPPMMPGQDALRT